MSDTMTFNISCDRLPTISILVLFFSLKRARQQPPNAR